MDKTLNSIKSLNIYPKRIFDYSNDLRKFFNNNKNDYKKKELAIELICIIPKEKENEDEKKLKYSQDEQSEQRKLFKLYNIFSRKNNKNYEIERNELNSNIWKNSNQYIYEIIRDNIEKSQDIFSLSKYINKDKDETIQLLKMFINFSKKGKIIMNQNNELCDLEKLKNEGKNKNEKIPEELKGIYLKLGVDIKEKLAHEIMERPCSEDLSYSDFCKQIDKEVIQKYNNPINHLDPKFKESVSCLIENYFDIIEEKDAQYFFPDTFANKDNIILNVIYDKETRKNLANLGKSYGGNAIPKILENPKMMNLILSGKLKDDNYQIIFNSLGEQKLNLNEQIIITDDSKKVSLAFNSDSISPEQADFCKNTFNNIINFGDDFDFENPVNRRTGNCGEAYIYELLLNSSKYKNVIWKMLNKEGKGELLEYNGKKYYINPDGSHYDIVVETFQGEEFFIEVKSTRHEFGNKVPFYISKKQIEMMKSVKFPNKYILAVVFNVMDNPKTLFYVSKK